ncbi:MAG TPA: cytidylate kinase-like family protein [Candidatus Rifleibacterium sp.]|jgi:cytidylate kinase|nr:cytidylate kinase-like family protein [Candidatus Rifleibacterium sp.]HPW57219.1 cytidylate kinase-like family protein [Candidatus Rifleibacterium sp.]
MPAVTISREIGASGTFIALKVAEALGYVCYDQQIINEIAHKMGKNKEQLEDFDQQSYNRIGVFFQEALASIAQGGMVFHPFGIGPLDWDSAEIFSTYPRNAFQEKDYYEVLSQVIKEISEKSNVVILGRGGSQILKDRSDTLHVRIVADRNERIQHVMKEQNLDQAKAEEVVSRKDEAAANFIYDFFDADWNDPHHYHMILNTSRIAPEKCIEMILNAVKTL